MAFASFDFLETVRVKLTVDSILEPDEVRPVLLPLFQCHLRENRFGINLHDFFTDLIVSIQIGAGLKRIPRGACHILARCESWIR